MGELVLVYQCVICRSLETRSRWTRVVNGRMSLEPANQRRRGVVSRRRSAACLRKARLGRALLAGPRVEQVENARSVARHVAIRLTLFRTSRTRLQRRRFLRPSRRAAKEEKKDADSVAAASSPAPVSLRVPLEATTNEEKKKCQRFAFFFPSFFPRRCSATLGTRLPRYAARQPSCLPYFAPSPSS